MPPTLVPDLGQPAKSRRQCFPLLRSRFLHAALLLAFCIFPVSLALDLPEEDFWSEDRRSVLWGDFMADAVYQKCPALQKSTPQHPIPDEDIYKLAQDYGGDGALTKFVAWDMRKRLGGTLKEVKKTFNRSFVGIARGSIRYSWFTALSLGCAVFAIGLWSVLMCMGCAGPIVPKSPKEEKEEEEKEEEPGSQLLIKCSCVPCCIPQHKCMLTVWAVGATMAIVGSLVLVVITAYATANIGDDIDHLMCQVYRFPYSIMFGVDHDQAAYFGNTGRNGLDLTGDETLPGVVDITNYSNKLQDAVIGTGPKSLFSTLRKLVLALSNEFIILIDRSLDDVARLTKAYSKTAHNLANLQKEKPHNHLCVMCSAAGAEVVSKPLADARELFKDLRENFDGIPEKLDDVFERPEIKEAKDQMESIMDVIYYKFSQFTNLYTWLNGKEQFVQSVSRQALKVILGAMAPFVVLGIPFAILIWWSWLKYRNPAPYQPSEKLTTFLFLIWSTLLFWGAVLLTAATFLLFIAGPAAEICIVTDELLFHGNYENYPWIAEALAPAVGRSNEDTMELLKSLAWLKGDGDLSTFLNITDVKDSVKSGATSAMKVFQRSQKETRLDLKNAGINDIREAILGGAFVIMPNMAEIKANDPEAADAFPEVLLSGLHLKTQPLDKTSQDKIKEEDKEAQSVGAISYGFDVAENKINEEFEKVVDNKKLCFGSVTSCSSKSGSHKVIESTFDPETDRDLEGWKRQLSDSQYKKIVASIEIMTWKLRLLKEKPFVRIGHKDAKTAVTYDQFVSPNPDSKAYVNSVVNGMTVEFEESMNALIDKVGSAGDAFVKLILSFLNTMPDFGKSHARVLAEIFAVKDPLCRGLLKPISATAVMWFILGILQIPISIVGFRYWNYLKCVKPDCNYFEKIKLPSKESTRADSYKSYLEEERYKSFDRGNF